MKQQINKQTKTYIFWAISLTCLLWLIQIPGALAAPFRQEAQDIALITQPAAGATVQGVVPIIGTATHPEFSFYVLEFSPDPGDQWQFIGDGQTSVVNGQLGVWDTATVPDGAYAIRLRVVRIDGNYSEAPIQQVVVSNSQPIPTDTPEAPLTEEGAAPSGPPTATSTPLPPTPTILVEQPIVDTPTPRPVETSQPLEDPDQPSSFVPTVTGFSLISLRDACIYGGGLMLSIFLLFGFLAALRTFVQGFIDRMRQRRS